MKTMTISKDNQEILNYYYKNNARNLESLVNKILDTYGGISQKDYGDFYDIANEVFAKIIGNFDPSKAKFNTYLYNCLKKKFDTEIRDQKADKRFANYSGTRTQDGAINTSVSMDIETEDGYCLRDTLESPTNIVDMLLHNNDEFSPTTQAYLDSLSGKQKQIMLLITDGYTKDEICNILKITSQKYDLMWSRMTSINKLAVFM